MSQTSTPPRALRKRERTRGELVAATERLVAARGIDAISIDDITQAADVAKGTFYTHFEDKDDIAAVISRLIRLELEEKITALNDGIDDAALRMANGLSTLFAFAIAQPVRARALLRLIPGGVDPDSAINAGIRGDIVMGAKAKRFSVASVNAAVVATIGIALSAGMHLSEATRRDPDPFEFAADIVVTALVALGMKQADSTRLAKTAMNIRKKEQRT